MKAKPLVQLLADLRVSKSLSRPRVSNDNPYSESQFKTLKYCPAFFDRFGSLQDARAFCRQSSPGTTANIITAGSDCSLRTVFITAWLSHGK